MKATERESSVLRPVNPLTSPSLGFGESDALTGTEPLRGGGAPHVCPTLPGGGERHLALWLSRKTLLHTHKPGSGFSSHRDPARPWGTW